MYRVVIMYPNKEGARFDFERYRVHMEELAPKYMKEFGLVKIGIEKGVSGSGGKPAPFICIGSLYFDTQDGYDRCMAKYADVIRGDIKNVTDIDVFTATRQVSEVLK